jgi:riboflavin kinase / FMN adenylyltransferase
MEIIAGWTDVPRKFQRAAIAIGNFDGVHRGHQAVLDAAITAARTQGSAAGVMIFEPHPREFFRPGKPLFRLTSLERKLELFAACGLDFTAILTFDDALAAMPAAQFAGDILVKGFNAAHVITGFDFFFGKGRDGNPSVLKALGEKHGFAATTVEAAGTSAEIFSSTRIRELLAEGDVRAAADMLGTWWQLSGMVQSGAGRGAGLGFPTANIAIESGHFLKHGIYAVRVQAGGRRLKGAAYLGTRPTFDDGLPVLEIFLMEFDGNLYDQQITVEFIDYIREDAKFKSAESLVTQMQRDIAKAASILGETERSDPMRGYEIYRNLIRDIHSGKTA